MMLRTVWSENPAYAPANWGEAPAMGLAAQEATQPSPRPGRDDGEALLAAGSSAASPRSRTAAKRPAARRRMGVRADIHDVTIYPPCHPQNTPKSYLTRTPDSGTCPDAPIPGRRTVSGRAGPAPARASPGRSGPAGR